MSTDLERRRALLTTALGFLQIGQAKVPHTGLTALHTWLDSSHELGAISEGMLRQGFETDLTGGPDGWSATFLKTRTIGDIEVVGSAHDARPFPFGCR